MITKLLSCCLILLNFGCHLKQIPSSSLNSLNKNNLKRFHLKILDTEQKDVSLASLQKNHEHSVIYHFFASWCQSCREELTQLAKEKLKLDPKLILIHISIDENSAIAKDVLNQSGFDSYSLVMDSKAQLLKESGISALPGSIGFNRKGEVFLFQKGPGLITSLRESPNKLIKESAFRRKQLF